MLLIRARRLEVCAARPSLLRGSVFFWSLVWTPIFLSLLQGRPPSCPTSTAVELGAHALLPRYILNTALFSRDPAAAATERQGYICNFTSRHRKERRISTPPVCCCRPRHRQAHSPAQSPSQHPRTPHPKAARRTRGCEPVPGTSPCLQCLPTPGRRVASTRREENATGGRNQGPFRAVANVGR